MNISDRCIFVDFFLWVIYMFNPGNTDRGSIGIRRPGGNTMMGKNWGVEGAI